MRERLLSGICNRRKDRKSTRLNSSHTEIYTLSLHDALPIYGNASAMNRLGTCFDHGQGVVEDEGEAFKWYLQSAERSEEHTSELQSHRDLHSFPTRRSSDLWKCQCDEPIRHLL